MTTKIYPVSALSGNLLYEKIDANYLTCHGALAVDWSPHSIAIENGRGIFGVIFRIVRSVSVFDQSADKIPPAATITSVVLNLKLVRFDFNTNPGWFLNIVSAIGVNVWSDNGYHVLESAVVAFGSLPDTSFDGGNHDIVLNADGITDIQSQIGSSPDELLIGYRSSRDISSSVPPLNTATEGDIDDFHDASTITITYTIPISNSNAIKKKLFATGAI
jgi:hypothetical protein